MIGNVQILKNSGVSLISNGLAHFKFNDTNKQYIIYTIGEQNNELMKIYIGYENAPVTDQGITDDESQKITDLVKKMVTNKDFSSIATILPLTEKLYHIHDVTKGVRIPVRALNNIISAQQRGQIQTLDKDEPIMKENSFFDSSTVVDSPKEENIQEESIFSNPMQPVIENPVAQRSSEEDAGIPQTYAQENAQATSVDGLPKEIGSNTGMEKDTLQQNSELITDNNSISDEEAKNAILAVESAQATIKENISIIKEYIKQQRKSDEQKVDSRDNIVKYPETRATDGQEEVHAQNDVINDLELAPQPEIPENVLSSEPDLVEVSQENNQVNEATTGTDYNSSLNTSVAVSENDFSNQNFAMPTSESSNQQELPTTTSIQKEGQPEIIDTMAMMPQNETSNVVSSIDTTNGEPQKVEMLDTKNMSILSGAEDTPRVETPKTIDNIQPTMVQDMMIPNSQTPTIDIQIPDIGVNNQPSVSSTPGVVKEESPSQINPVLQDGNMSIQEQARQQKPAGSSEFSIPQIDMNVSTVNQQQAPVTLPDGQSQDNNQELILTPDAFNKAA